MNTQTQSATVTMPSDREIRMERIFNAPRERVWKAMTDRTLIAQWWGRGNKVDIEKYEPEKGGHWRIVEHSDGQTHGFEGRFREITPIERIVQTFEWDGMPGYVIIDTAELEDLGDGRTRLVSTSLFHTTEERDGMASSGMAEGAEQSYQALDRLLASMS